MARRRHIDVTARSSGAPDAVWTLLADGATWPAWSPIEASALERAGESSPEGPGAIRRFRHGRTVGRDEILEAVPGRRLAYRSLSGLPVRDYRAEVDLEPGPEGTEIRWRASFQPRLLGTGWLLERGIDRFLRGCAQAGRAGRRCRRGHADEAAQASGSATVTIPAAALRRRASEVIRTAPSDAARAT